MSDHIIILCFVQYTDQAQKQLNVFVYSFLQESENRPKFCDPVIDIYGHFPCKQLSHRNEVNAVIKEDEISCC